MELDRVGAGGNRFPGTKEIDKDAGERWVGEGLEARHARGRRDLAADRVTLLAGSDDELVDVGRSRAEANLDQRFDERRRPRRQLGEIEDPQAHDLARDFEPNQRCARMNESNSSSGRSSSRNAGCHPPFDLSSCVGCDGDGLREPDVLHL